MYLSQKISAHYTAQSKNQAHTPGQRANNKSNKSSIKKKYMELISKNEKVNQNISWFISNNQINLL